MEHATKVLSVFAGLGKSHYASKSNKALDLDSRGFSWVNDDEGRKRNPYFPNNYIEHIKSNIGRYDYILVSSHEDVRKELADNGIEYVNVLPEITLKQEYMKRYKDRGNPETFIGLMDKEYTNFVNSMKEDGHADSVVITKEGIYLTDIIRDIWGK